MIRAMVVAVVLLGGPCAWAQGAPKAPATPVTLRSQLLKELRNSHNIPDWFTPINAAVAGMTPEQARWVPANAQGKMDPENNHSVGMLAFHLLFWNRQTLRNMRGEKVTAPPPNVETFNDFDAAKWAEVVKGLDEVMTGLEEQVSTMSDADLQRWAPVVANICEHNAYHTGQILYVRKLQGSWNPDNGVK